MRDPRGSDMSFLSNGLFLGLVAALLIGGMGSGVTSSWKKASTASPIHAQVASR